MHLPNLSSARLIGLAALTCIAMLAFAGGLAAATAASPAAPSAGPTAGVVVVAPPTCATSGLVAWLDTQGNGTLGSVYYNLELTNLSGHKCTLVGYPGVSAVNLAGHQLGSAAAHDTTKAPHLVTLARGATAIAVLRIVDAGNFTNSACHEVTAAGLRVYPPNQTKSKIVPFPFAACSHAGPLYLTVQDVHHG